MTIPICTTEKSETGSEYDLSSGYAERRRRSTFSIPTLRRALARRMWGLNMRSVPEPRRGSRARTFAFVAAVEHLRRSGSIIHHKPQVQSAIALLNLGIKKVERLRRSKHMQKVFGVPMQFLAYPRDKSYSEPVSQFSV